MLTNKQKYDYYVKTLDVIERGWTQNNLENSSGHCLVGAINVATFGRADGWRYSIESEHSNEMQEDLVGSLLTRRRVLLNKIHTMEPEGEDGGLLAIEMWNDTPWRRKTQVTRLLKKRIAHYEPLARQEEITRLTRLVEHLRARIPELEAKVAALTARVQELENENRFLRKSKTAFTATQLRAESQAMRELDEELDDALADLQKYGVVA